MIQHYTTPPLKKGGWVFAHDVCFLKFPCNVAKHANVYHFGQQVVNMWTFNV